MESIRKKTNLQIVIALSVSIVFVLLIVIFYAINQYHEILDQVERDVTKDTLHAAETVKLTLDYNSNGIQVASGSFSRIIKNRRSILPDEVIKLIKEDTNFTEMSYTDQKGISISKQTDFSDSTYFKSGIHGRTGVWVDYSLESDKQPKLNFYTPIIIENKNIGVLYGVLDPKITFRTLFSNSFKNDFFYTLILDENDRVIVGNGGIEFGKKLDGLTEANRCNEALHYIDKTGQEDEIDPSDRESVMCSIVPVDGYGWHIVNIVPKTSMKSMIVKFSRQTTFTIAFVIFVGICVFCFVNYKSKEISKYLINTANKERDAQISVLFSMSDMYHSMHLIDLEKNDLVEYSTQTNKSDEIDNQLPADVFIKNFIKNSMTSESLKYALEFTNLRTLPNRMKDKKFIFTELKGHNVGWIRVGFISVETNQKGIPRKVVLTTRIIDAEKRREQDLIMKSTTDQLTGFYNRRAYEYDLEMTHGEAISDKFVYISFDVNGLKVVNDTMGHVAGDELLRGASQCIEQCFAQYGKLYRMGGDEFSAMIEVDVEELPKIFENFEKVLSEWTGELIKSITISYGYACKKEFPKDKVVMLAKYADERMYEFKTKFYQKKGMDRRGQSRAQTVLCSLYAKILKINLTDDTNEIVSISESEKEHPRGYSPKISSWFFKFAQAGNVYKDDIDEYLAKTKLKFLSDYFKSGKSSISIEYRRLSGDKFKPTVMQIVKADDYSDDNQSLFLYVKEED